MSIYRKIKTLITKLDFMGMTPSLKIEGSDSYKTPVGGILNIILVFLSILGVIYFGKELIIKQEPIIVVSQTQDKQVGPFEINNENFNIFVGIEYPNFTYYQNPRVYTVNATIGRIEHTDNQTIESILPLEVTLCESLYTKDDIMDLFGKAFDTEVFHCVKPNSATIEGFWGNSIYSNIRISVHRCTNTTENNNHCLSDEVIDSYVNGGIISTYATNPFISYSNIDSPIKMKLSDVFNSLNTDLTFDYVFQINNLEFQDDQGFILQELKTANFPAIESVKTLYYVKRGSTLCNITIEGNPLGRKITRSYNKFQDVLTKIGGLIKALTVVASFISLIYSEFQFYADSIFNFEFQIEKEKDKSLNNLSNKKFNNLLNNNNNSVKINHQNCISTAKKESLFANKSLNELVTEKNNHHNADNNKSKEFLNTQELNYSKNVNQSQSSPITKNYSEFKMKKINNFVNDIQNEELNKKIIVSNNFTNSKSSSDNIKDFKLLNSTNSLYPTGKYFKDMISQLAHSLYCKKYNERLYLKKKNYDNKIKKFLSIDYIFKKFYTIELLSNKLLKLDNNEYLHNDYIRQLFDINYNNADENVFIF